MAKKLTTVLVGCGGVSRAWLGSIAALPGVTVAGLVDIREGAAQACADEFKLKGARAGTDLKAMLKAVKPDMVFDCTVPEAHCGVVTEALRHGCHVLGEKPLADSMENARRMVAAARRADRLYAVMQNRRFDNRIRAYQGLIHSGTLGDLTTLNCDFYIGAHFGGFRDHMKHVLLLDMAIHTFDAARFISGCDAVSVYCREWNPRGSWYDHDASAVAMFEMTNGVVYTYRGSWCSEGLGTTWECDWRAICTRGSSKWNGGDAFVTERATGDAGFVRPYEPVEVKVNPKAPHGGHAGLIADFVRCVRAGRTPETAASDNIRSLAMVFAAIESAETGKPVRIR
jgi:predicted dehydrogenase